MPIGGTLEYGRHSDHEVSERASPPRSSGNIRSRHAAPEYEWAAGTPGLLFVNLYDSMDDWNLSPLYFEHHNLAYAERRVPHIQEENVASLEAGLHASAACKRRKNGLTRRLLPVPWGT